MQAAVQAALRQILNGLKYDAFEARGRPVPLQLYDEDSSLLPTGVSIF